MIKDNVFITLLVIITILLSISLFKDRYSISTTGKAICYKLDKWAGQVWIITGYDPEIKIEQQDK